MSGPMNAVFVPVDPTAPIEEFEIKAKFGDEIRGRVGGYMEGVRLRAWGAVMYVDEDGLVKDKPLNPRATMAAAANGVLHPGLYIAGDVVFVGSYTEDGWDTPVTPETVEKIRQLDELMHRILDAESLQMFETGERE